MLSGGNGFFEISTLIFPLIFRAVLIWSEDLSSKDGISRKEVDLSILGTKVLFTATLGLIAKWISKRTNLHLTEESKYHRLAINMKTIDPFIEKLPEDKKNAILAAKALKTFTEIRENTTAADFETASVADAIKGLLPKAEK